MYEFILFVKKKKQTNCVYLIECVGYFAGITSTLLPISAYIEIMAIISVKENLLSVV